MSRIGLTLTLVDMVPPLDMVRLGTLEMALAVFLGARVRAGKNIVVMGLQNVGNTTWDF